MSHDHQIALVTGANKGIGKELVRQLLKQGFTVYLGSRDTERGQAALTELQGDGRDVRLLPLDLTDPASLEQAAATLEQDGGRLDLLINNAGIVGGRAVPSKTRIEDLRAAYETNFFGPFLLTQALLPLLRRSARPTIVNVSSGLGSLALIGYPLDEFAGIQVFSYQSSKAALNSLTVLFAKELRAQGFRVNSVSPGYTATDLNGFRGTESVEDAAAMILKTALAGEGSPTGGFFAGDGQVPW